MTMSRISRRNFVKLMGAGGALSLFGYTTKRDLSAMG